MTDIFTRILNALEAVTDQSTSALKYDTDIADELDLDSIQFVQFLLTLEDAVPGLEFTQETLSDAAFTTLGDIADFVQTNQNLQLVAE